MVARAEELRELDDDELENRLAEYRRELMNLRFQLATGQLDNSSRLPQVRRDVARVLTVLRERDIDVAEADLAAAERAPVLREEAARRRAEDAAARDEEAAAAAAAADAGGAAAGEDPAAVTGTAGGPPAASTAAGADMGDEEPGDDPDGVGDTGDDEEDQ